MESSMHSFYSRLVSTDNNPLLNTLRSLSRLDPRVLIAGDDANVWSPWDPTGDPPPDCISRLVANPA
jgi:hypothetical protein